MSLLDEAFENFILLDQATSADGYGGYNTTWTNGATIKAAISFENSNQALIAQASGSTSAYKIYTKKSVTLMYHQVLKRASDNKIFRVTSDGDDKFTPKSASLNLREVTAEEFEIG